MPKSSKPWVPNPPPVAVTMAIKGLAAGTASDEQQKRALAWIINELCGTYDMSFHPDSQRASDFAEGKRFVGTQIVKEVNINPSLIRKESEHG